MLVKKVDGYMLLRFLLPLCSFSWGSTQDSFTEEISSHVSGSGERYAHHSYAYCPELNGKYWEVLTEDPGATVTIEEKDRFYWIVKTYIHRQMDRATYIFKDAKDTSPIDKNNNILYLATGHVTYDENYPPLQPGDGFIYHPREVRVSCYQGVPNFVSSETSGFAKSVDTLGAIQHRYRTTSKMYVLPNGDIKEEYSTYIDGVGTFENAARIFHKN